MDNWTGGGSLGLEVSYRSLGENMVFEELLEFMFCLEKEQNRI